MSCFNHAVTLSKPMCMPLFILPPMHTPAHRSRPHPDVPTNTRWVLEASNQNAWEMALVHQASVESEKENDAKRRMEALREEQLKTEGDVFGEDGFGQVREMWMRCFTSQVSVVVLMWLTHVHMYVYDSPPSSGASTAGGAPAWWPSCGRTAAAAAAAAAARATAAVRRSRLMRRMGGRRRREWTLRCSGGGN